MIRELLGNPLFVAPALAWLVAQTLKILLEMALTRSFDFWRFFGSGGMPSSHSATVCALVVATAARYGVGGFELPMAFFFAFIVMYDARGVRHETGEQAKAINAMMELLENTFGVDIPGPDEFKELVGHTLLQVVAGAIVGIVVALVTCHSYGLL